MTHFGILKKLIGRIFTFLQKMLIFYADANFEDPKRPRKFADEKLAIRY